MLWNRFAQGGTCRLGVLRRKAVRPRLWTSSAQAVSYDTKHSTPLINVGLKDNGVALVTLNRPGARNALSTELANQLCDVFAGIKDGSIRHENVSSVRAVVFTGAGTSFCAGADLKERQGMTDAQWEAQHKVFQKAGLMFQNLPCPTIVAANGHAFGGGFEFVCLADWSVANEDALFRFPEVRLGIFPGLGGTQTLPRLIGLQEARRLLLTGAVLPAKEAYRLGLFTSIQPGGEATVAAAMKDADTVAENGPNAVRRAKRSIWEGYQTPDFKEAWDFSLDLYGECFRSEERVEGIKAYGEKRSPKFD
jgi:enoyl-CoA hydratase|eukprot:g1288.t1